MGKNSSSRGNAMVNDSSSGNTSGRVGRTRIRFESICVVVVVVATTWPRPQWLSVGRHRPKGEVAAVSLGGEGEARVAPPCVATSAIRVACL